MSEILLLENNENILETSNLPKDNGEQKEVILDSYKNTNPIETIKLPKEDEDEDKIEELRKKILNYQGKTYLKWWQQVLFGICLCLFIFPCCVFYSSVNTLSTRIEYYFNDPNIIANAYVIYSVESIFTAPFTGVLCDLFTCGPILLAHELLILTGALLCSLSKTGTLFLIGRAGYSEAMLCIQGKLIIRYIHPSYQALMYGIIYASYMLGDSTASLVARIPDTGLKALNKCYWVIFYCLLAGLCFAIPFITVEFKEFYAIKKLKRELKQLITRVETKQNKADETNNNNLIIPACEVPNNNEQIYVELLKKKKKIKEKNAKCSTFCKSILNFPAAYWCALIARCLFMGSKSTYDANSVKVLQDYFKVDNEIANNCFMTQQIVSAVIFPIASVFSDFDVCCIHKWKKNKTKQKSKVTLIYILLIGYILFFGSQLTIVFILKNGETAQQKSNEVGAYLISSIIGTGMGFFASNSTTMLAQIVGKEAAATAIGLSFAVQFIYMSCYLQVTNWIKKEYDNITLSTVYTIILGIGLILMIVIVSLWNKLIMASSIKTNKKKSHK